MKSSKRVVKVALAGALVLAMGVTTLFAHAGSSYAAGEAKLNETSRNILTQRSYDFDVTGAPADAVITWKSSDDKVASVDKDGVVTGIKKGNVTITCEIASAGKTQKLTAKVKVCKPAVKIEITNKIFELEYGQTYDLNYTLTPRKSNDVVTWESSDTEVAAVNKNGIVKALADGVTTITATTLSGRSDSVEIWVYGAPEPTPTPSPTPEPTPTPEPEATQAPDATATPVPTVTPKPTETPEPTATPKPTSKPRPTATPKPAKQEVVYEESFENGLGGWAGRGGSEALSTLQSVSSPDGRNYLMVKGRSQNWHGAAINMNKILEVGGVYNVSAWVMQKSKDGEVIKATTAKNNGSGDRPYVQINEGGVTTMKGEWTEITGQIIVTEDTKDLVFYFEADTPNLEFMVDHIVIKKVSGGSGLIYKPLQVEGGAVTLKAVDLGLYGWTQGNNEKVGDVVKAGFTKQYDAVVFLFPEPLTLGDFSKIYVKMSTTNKVAFRLLDEADQEMAFWWARGSADMENIELDFTKATKPDYSGEEAISSAVLAKKTKALVIMTTDAACDAVIESISLVPAK